MSTNNSMPISKVVSIIQSVLGDTYKLTIGGSDGDVINIQNLITRKNTYSFKYYSSIDYSSFPFVSYKSLDFKEHVGINATSERYCSNPDEDGIKYFVKLCFGMD